MAKGLGFKQLPVHTSTALLSILLCACSTAMVTYLRLKSIKWEALLFTCSSQYMEANILKLIVLVHLAVACLSFFCNVLVHSLISLAYRTVLRNTLLEYLKLKYTSFAKIGLGAVQCLVSRRSSAFCDMLESSVVRTTPKLVLLFALVPPTLSLLDHRAKLYVLSAFAVFILVMLLLQVLRACLLAKINTSYEISNSKRIEILESYERVIPYNTLEDELNDYRRTLDEYAYFKQVFDCSGHLIGFVSGMALLLFSVCVWRCVSDHRQLTSIAVLTERLKDCLYSVLAEFDALIVDYANYSYSKHTPSEVENSSCTGNSGCGLYDFTGDISLDSLCIKLDGYIILNNVTLTIKKSEKVAITGTNGCGKSALIGAMVGFADYDGSVKIDGFEVRSLPRATLSRLISYIPQNAKVFNTSIEHNLKIGRDDIDGAEMVETCSRFGCHSIFKDIGYSKSMGDRGRLLSGGQKQRVALLSAILKDSKILIFDGPFAGLDQKTEEHFVKTLRSESNDRTVVCSTQNIALFPHFDQVIFIHNGAIYKDTFKMLLKTNEEFRAFCRVKESAELPLKVFSKRLLAAVKSIAK